MPRSLRRVVIAAVMLAAVLSAAATLVFASGRASFVVTHGHSMEPVYHQGDLVVVVKESSYRIGEIAAYKEPGNPETFLHRIIGGNATTGYTFKGDNNQSVDPTHPTARLIEGHAVLHLAQGGLWLHRLTSPLSLWLIGFFSVAGSGTAVHARSRRQRALHAYQRPIKTTSLLSITSVSPLVRSAAGITGAAVLLDVALAVLAWHGPPQRNVPVTTATAGKMTFSYSANVGHTAAYDGTVAHSPDPIFRHLANVVDVHLDYHGEPGSVSVAAVLSTSTGWHTSVALTPAATFTGQHYAATVPLNLNDLAARWQAAAAATGIPSGSLTVAFTPTIRSAGEQPFSPALNLTLTPLQLNLTGDASTLVVTQPSTAAHTKAVARTITIMNHTITVRRARLIDKILLVLILIACFAIAVIAHQTTPVDEASAIRRRYSPILVKVEPMTMPAGRPVIDVSGFGMLVKLAERYGLLIMHWIRADVETFVVQDEASTYRYRTGSGATDVDDENELSAPVAASGRPAGTRRVIT